MSDDDIVLPGFFCTACKVWNSTAKGRDTCRSCDAKAPSVELLGRGELLRILSVVLRENVQLSDQMTSIQVECSGIRTALAWYADEKNYVYTDTEIRLSTGITHGLEDAPVVVDSGHRARAVLYGEKDE